MLRLIVRRVLMSLPLLFVVSLVVYVLEALIPGNPAATIAGVNATQSQIAALARKLGLDKPFWTQYGDWLGHAIRGSLGHSVIDNSSVAATLNQRLPVTICLVLGATIVAAVVGVGLGILCARGPRVVARLVDVLSILGLAVPSFWVALILISIVSVQLGWLPAVGYVSFATSPSGWLKSLILPVAALSLNGVTIIAKLTRDAMLDVLGGEFVRNMRANGLNERTIIYRHALRNSAVRIVTMMGLLFIGALGGSVVIEQVFGLPGLGSLAVSATNAKDIPVIQGVAVYFTLLVVGMNLLTDIVYAWIDPRVRVG